ncbi:hypothetical protein Q8W71_25505 [Methylobacterium sp. NEAU 140]|nr:hypothetical protein [Methylobacterium sp. NEAU 140]MDP4025994.1 hypothetical protein [Methylobacterium sp. NEAU 140]
MEDLLSAPFFQKRYAITPERLSFIIFGNLMLNRAKPMMAVR